MNSTLGPPGSPHAMAYWTIGPHVGEIRQQPLPLPRKDEALVRTVYSGISRGTELLIHAANVPRTVTDVMRAPFQEGTFPFPVKYGYLNVGVVETGPAEWVNKRVFCLFPHQDRFVAPLSALTPLPDTLPSTRALLAGPVETAVNALWDAPPLFGDRVAVVGGGIIGGSLATLLQKFPLERLQIVDPDPSKTKLAEALGVEWVHPDQAMAECDIVYHASATESGLATSLAMLGDEGELIELSWYGDRSPRVPLGADFHARRLSIRASQVSRIAGSRRQRKTSKDRMNLVIDALNNPVFDQLIGSTHSFTDLPTVMDALRHDKATGRITVIDYESS